MKIKHKCVENGGCKAAECDGGISKSQQKRYTAMGLYEKAAEAQKDLREWQILIIQLVSDGATLTEETVQAYRQAVVTHNRYYRLLAKDMCK